MWVMCEANVSDSHFDMIAVFLRLDEATRRRLLRLRNVWKTVRQFEHCSSLYKLEIFDQPDYVLFKKYHQGAFEQIDDNEWYDGEEPRDEPGHERPRYAAMTLDVVEDGVWWSWYDHYSNEVCSTAILKWDQIADGHAIERCEKCGTPFSQASIDGGRCLGSDVEGRFCGTMIVGVSAEVKE